VTLQHIRDNANAQVTGINHGAGSDVSLPTNQLDLVKLQAGDLAPVTLSVAAGECLVLAGASGSGKSRLLRVIADLDASMENAAGQIVLGGVDLLHYSGPEWRRRVAYLAAESQWWFDDVAAHFSIMPTPEQMQSLGLKPELLQQAVSRLSSGERQRLALLRLLVQQPRVLLLDEPTASLDPEATRAVEQLIADYRQQHQAAVIWVSHDVNQAGRVGQHYFYINQGRVCDQGDGSTRTEDE